MFVIKSYINIPDVRITDLEELNNNPKEFFIEIADNDAISSIRDKLELDYLHGVIWLNYNGNLIMDFKLWDLVDQLWSYLISLIEEVLIKGKAETYFPDQPVKITIESISNTSLLLTIKTQESSKSVLPKYEFFMALLDASKYFFEKMLEYFDEKKSFYNSELARIESLKQKVNGLKIS